MKIGLILFLLLPLLGYAYVYWHLWNLLPLHPIYKIIILVLLSMGLVCLFFGFGVGLEKLSLNCAEVVYGIGTSSLFILLYAVMLFLLLDLGQLVHLIPTSFLINSWRGTFTVLGIITAFFVYGNIHYNNKVLQELDINS